MPLTEKTKRNLALESGTSTDDFLGGRVKVVQPKSGHRAGSDAVLLAGAVRAGAGTRVLDVGAGVGVAGLCLLARIPQIDVTAAEVDEVLCALAAQNAERNGFSEHFNVVNVDVMSPAKLLEESGLVREGYGQVMANPPFYAEGSVCAAPDAVRAIAHVMPAGELERWVRFVTNMTAQKGNVTLIHRADCLSKLLPLLEGRFGDIAVFPLFPKAGEPAKRVIVQGRKGSRAALRLLSGLVLHGPEGAYTEEAEAVLRGGEPLYLDGLQEKRGHRSGGRAAAPFRPGGEESSRARKVR
jgi:tRNA1(Val) A37 N6-methylase TrmN6